MSAFYRIAYCVVKPLSFPFLWLRVRGREQVPKTGPLIFCCNHRSYWDPVILSLCNWRQVHYMAKQELFDSKLNRVIRWLGAFPVERGRTGDEAMGAAGELLRQGKILGLFPEGTRSKDGKIQRLKAGTILVAHRAGVPIVPVTIYCEKKMGLFRRITVRFGTPVSVGDLGVTSESGAEVRNGVRALQTRMEALLEEKHG